MCKLMGIDIAMMFNLYIYGVLLTPSGHRFVDELLPRDQV